MPKEVIETAERTLKELESKQSSRDEGVQLSFFQLDDPTLSSLREKLAAADLNNLTPLQAFDLLREMKAEVGV